MSGADAWAARPAAVIGWTSADWVGPGFRLERGKAWADCGLLRRSSLIRSSRLIGMAAAAVAPCGPATSTGTGGAAASVETLATQAAIDALKRGGNAVDAAVTAAGVLGVAEPFSCGLGGGGFMVIYRASDGKVTTIDGRETAPAAMTPTSFMWVNGKAPDFTTARYSGRVGRRARHPGNVGRGAREVRDVLARPDARSGRSRSRVTASSSTRCSTIRSRGTSKPSATCRLRRRSTSSRTARRSTSAPSSETRTSRARTSASRTWGSRASIAERSLTRSSTPCRPRRSPTTATPGWRHPGVMTMRDLHDYVAPSGHRRT